MKDTEIHNGLEGKEMRNFYQETLIQYDLRELASQKKCEEAKKLAYEEWNLNRSDKLSSLRLRVKLSQIEADHSNELLRVAECRLGLYLTMDGLGWSDYNTSDYIPKSGDRYRNFIGTKEEYETFVYNITKDGK